MTGKIVQQGQRFIHPSNVAYLAVPHEIVNSIVEGVNFVK